MLFRSASDSVRGSAVTRHLSEALGLNVFASTEHPSTANPGPVTRPG